MSALNGITVNIVENVTYQKTYTFEELGYLVGQDLTGRSVEEISELITYNFAVEEDMQRHSDSPEQVWTVTGEDMGTQLVTEYDGSVQVMTFDSLQGAYDSLRQNFAEDEDVQDEDLVSFVMSQGVTVYLD